MGNGMEAAAAADKGTKPPDSLQEPEPVSADGAVLSPVRAHSAERPSDSRAWLRRGTSETTFAWSGRWHAQAIVMATFVTVFWNSIVGVFVVELCKQFNLFLAVFLVPFEVIGVLFAVYWLACLTGPAWRRRWIFRPHEIARRDSALGIAWQKGYPVTQRVRIEVPRGESA